MSRIRSFFIFLAFLTGCSESKSVSITASTDFDGGSADNIEISSSGKDIVFSIRRDPGGDEHLWFYFRLDSDKPIKPRFTVREPGKAHFVNWDAVRPVVSSDGRNWVRATKIEFDPPWKNKSPDRKDEFSFYSPIASTTLYVAYSFPYVMSDLESLMNSVLEDGRVKTSSVGVSEEGREIPWLTISSVKEGGNDDRKEIWVIGREHPGETASSFVLEGFVHSLLQSDTGASLIQDYTFQIVPFLNIDGVAKGNYYRNQKGQRLDLDWDDFNTAEVGALYQKMKPALEDRRVALTLSLHSANAPEGHFFIERKPDRLPVQLRKFQKKAIDSSNGIHPHYRINSTIEMWERPDIAGNHLPDTYQSLCLYFESNYHRAADGSYVSEASLREAGEALVHIIDRAIK